MKVIKSIKEASAYVAECKQKSMSVGLVPTMGALHEGHISLVEKSVEQTDITLASIFVNPIQFNNPEDLKKYPRTMEKDLEMLQAAGCNMVFCPDVDEMYPDEVTKEYDFGGLADVMEGEFRPGHFNGVAVVVNKLFTIMDPDKAFFGEKDFQQLAIIKKMVKLDKLPVNIVPCPTVREKDGLAMSSRNMRLSEADRAMAPLISQVLTQVTKDIHTMTVDECLTKARNVIKDNSAFELEYIDLVDFENLQPVVDVYSANDMVVCIAAWLGGVRLIDNKIIYS